MYFSQNLISPPTRYASALKYSYLVFISFYLQFLRRVSSYVGLFFTHIFYLFDYSISFLYEMYNYFNILIINNSS